MCGIVGYVGPRQASDVLLGGLPASSTAATTRPASPSSSGGDLDVARRVGKLANLREAVARRAARRARRHRAHALGHARPADRGERAPARRLHRQHRRGAQRHHRELLELREELAATGHILRSETDTETIAHLIESYYDGDLTAAVAHAARRLDGSYALAVVHRDDPDTIVAAARTRR